MMALFPNQTNPMIALKALTWLKGGDLETLPEELRRDLSEAASAIRAIPQQLKISSRRLD